MSTVGARPHPSLRRYTTELARHRVRVVPGAAGTVWTGYESGSIRRLPLFHVAPPVRGEIRRALWCGRATVAGYLLAPDARHPANGWLYICTDRDYALAQRPAAFRRAVRQGLTHCRIARLTPDELLAHGFPAFHDTRCRHGLSDGTLDAFRERFIARARVAGHVFYGAWAGDRLAAFLSVTEVDDWAEIEGSFSVDALRHLRPNDALVYTILSYYMRQRACHAVHFGLSSIQAATNAVGLHAFKVKVGFEARLVHRAFAIHPLLRPLVNGLTLWGVRTALLLRPGDRRLKKAGGIVTTMLGLAPPVDAREKI